MADKQPENTVKTTTPSMDLKKPTNEAKKEDDKKASPNDSMSASK
jgi:hypothetical protein